MQTRQESLTHNQTKESYPFSHMSKEQEIGLAKDIKQTQYPNYLQTIQKDRTNLRNPKNQPPLRRIQNTLFLRATIH